ncbi:ATP-grasp fold amidoligase family protein [Halomonas sp. AOP12-C2-37]|uniref:acylphosphatase n=1 Tax=Halomonas casei TaxID=2742613 RepID=A0ABR9F133_9GAMM|nr:ATP-grasp fold amidoligase family protein [Halomonas casei]MBE0398960.1 acylphosphatase [Halomonas casei]
MYNMMTKKIFVSGKVQGVGFRKYLKSEASKLNVSGWVRNLDDGRVEVLVSGNEESLASFYIAIMKETSGFKVDSFEKHKSNIKVADGFKIRKTRAVGEVGEIKKSLFLKYIDELFESPRAAGLRLDLPKVVSDIIEEKSQQFYKYRITRENLDKERGYNRKQLNTLVSLAHPRQISHIMLRHIERRKLSVKRALSFHTIMMQESEERRIGSPVLGWQLDEKTKAYNFADSIGLRRPDCNNQTYTFDEIEKPTKPMVLKPVKSTGARGVAFFYSDNDIVLLRDKKKFSSWEDFCGYTKKYVLKNDENFQGIRDKWMLEELILESKENKTPGRDLKFYTFYGKVVFVLEIVRGEKVRHCFWSRDGERLADTGKYIGDDWVGEGIALSQIESVEEVSLKIPVPFMRIDMLKSEGEMVLGEFTPRPGQWDEFTEDYDRWLGEEHTKARSRILQDLIQGKKFTEFAELMEGNK